MQRSRVIELPPMAKEQWPAVSSRDLVRSDVRCVDGQWQINWDGTWFVAAKREMTRGATATVQDFDAAGFTSLTYQVRPRNLAPGSYRLCMDFGGDGTVDTSVAGGQLLGVGSTAQSFVPTTSTATKKGGAIGATSACAIMMSNHEPLMMMKTVSIAGPT